MARARRAGGPAAARRLGGARGDDRARRGPQSALGHLGIERPPAGARRSRTSSTISTRTPRVPRGDCGARAAAWASSGTRPPRSSGGRASRRAAGGRRSRPRRASASGSPIRAFFERIVELAGCDAGRGGVRRRSCRQRRHPGGCRQASSRSTSAAGRGDGCSGLPRRPAFGLDDLAVAARRR